MGPPNTRSKDSVDSEYSLLKEEIYSLKSDINSIKENQLELKALFTTIQQLQKHNEEKDKRILELETRVQDLEQYTRIDDLIITGLQTTHRSFSNVVGSSSSRDYEERREKTDEEVNKLEDQVVGFLTSKGIQITHDDISACHTLKSRSSSAKQNIIIRLVNRKTKINILRSAKNLRGTNVYINEHLTKNNAELARISRKLKQEGKIAATWTRNCKVFIKTMGTPELSQTHCIRQLNDFAKLNISIPNVVSTSH